MQKRIYLCLAHMSGQEQKFIQEAFDTNWVVPLGPNVNGFEEDLKHLETLLQEGLTPLQREIFNLVTHEGMEYEQVAEKLSMSVEAVRKNMSRTRKKMRETYNQLNR